jgi:predicted neuraminidase
VIAWCCALAFSPARDSTVARPAALQPPPVNTRPGNEYAAGLRVFEGIPAIERTTDGRLWAAWFARHEGGDDFVQLVVSDDEGVTWSPPRLVIDPLGDVCAFDPCLWLDPEGMLWLFWAQSAGRWDGRGGVWCVCSEDSQARMPTWSAPRRICDGVMLNKPCALSDRGWLLPVSVWEMPADPALSRDDLPRRRPSSGAHVFSTADFGQSFSHLASVLVPERRYDEHHIVPRRDGSLWMLLRTPRGIAESDSADGGKTWSTPARSVIPHVNSRFCIRRLRSGSLLLVTQEPPDGKTRSHLVARLSTDDGRTWQGGLLLDERPGVSYPDATEGPKGTIHVIYDFERTGSRQILLAQFNEGSVLRGKPSRSTKLRTVVNATKRGAQEPGSGRKSN